MKVSIKFLKKTGIRWCEVNGEDWRDHEPGTRLDNIEIGPIQDGRAILTCGRYRSSIGIPVDMFVVIHKITVAEFLDMYRNWLAKGADSDDIRKEIASFLGVNLDAVQETIEDDFEVTQTVDDFKNHE